MTSVWWTWLQCENIMVGTHLSHGWYTFNDFRVQVWRNWLQCENIMVGAHSLTIWTKRVRQLMIWTKRVVNSTTHDKSLWKTPFWAHCVKWRTYSELQLENYSMEHQTKLSKSCATRWAIRSHGQINCETREMLCQLPLTKTYKNKMLMKIEGHFHCEYNCPKYGTQPDQGSAAWSWGSLGGVVI